MSDEQSPSGSVVGTASGQKTRVRG